MAKAVTVQTIDELNKLAGQKLTLYTLVSVLDYPVFTLLEGYSCIKTDFYFHYNEDEALHISLREKQTLWSLLDNLCRELDYV